MPRLPMISGKELIKLLLREGYYIRNQKGSHVHLRHAFKKPVTIPNHKVIAKGTLKEILKITELDIEELE